MTNNLLSLDVIRIHTFDTLQYLRKHKVSGITRLYVWSMRTLAKDMSLHTSKQIL